MMRCPVVCRMDVWKYSTDEAEQQQRQKQHREAQQPRDVARDRCTGRWPAGSAMAAPARRASRPQSPRRPPTPPPRAAAGTRAAAASTARRRPCRRRPRSSPPLTRSLTHPFTHFPIRSTHPFTHSLGQLLLEQLAPVHVGVEAAGRDERRRACRARRRARGRGPGFRRRRAPSKCGARRAGRRATARTVRSPRRIALLGGRVHRRQRVVEHENPRDRWRARARCATRCFWPPDSVMPRSPTTVS